MFTKYICSITNENYAQLIKMIVHLLSLNTTQHLPHSVAMYRILH